MRHLNWIALILLLWVVSLVLAPPAFADALFGCHPDNKNPSTTHFYVSVTEDRISVYDVDGVQILAGPFDQLETVTTEEGTRIIMRFEHANNSVYNFAVGTFTSGMRKVTFAVTVNDSSTVFWECK